MWRIGLICLFSGLLGVSQCWAEHSPLRASLAPKLDAILAKHRTQRIGVSVLDVENNKVVYDLNAAEPLKPASVMKIVPSVIALELLGPEYVFRTELFSDVPVSQVLRTGRIPTLVVKGGGDPSLTIESLHILARTLYRRGVREVGALVLDNTLFADERDPSGQRAYETGSSALSFNFNAIGFEICPGQAGERALVAPDPWEAPVAISGSIKSVAGAGENYSVEALNHGARQGSGKQFEGRFSASGTIGERAICEWRYRSVDSPETMFALTFLQVLRQFGITLPETFRVGQAPHASQLFYSHRSQSLSRTIEDLNHFSTNFIAEQLLFAIAGYAQDGRLHREDGLRRMQAFMRENGIPEAEFELHDASGLSHANRLSARAVTAALRRAYMNSAVRPEFEISLSMPGRRGTLKKRIFEGIHGIVRAKTGSIDGVSSLAGFVTSRTGKTLAFAIFNNSANNRDNAYALEEKIVVALSGV